VKLANYLSSTKILSIESQKKIDPDFTVLDPNYTAPEVVNTFSFSPASDIWSLGCCLVEMLTGSF
jgi:serine/threonine protein kinase